MLISRQIHLAVPKKSVLQIVSLQAKPGRLECKKHGTDYAINHGYPVTNVGWLHAHSNCGCSALISRRIRLAVPKKSVPQIVILQSKPGLQWCRLIFFLFCCFEGKEKVPTGPTRLIGTLQFDRCSSQ